MYILCDSSNNKNACDKVILHAEKEENFVQTRVKTATGRTVMRTAMDRTRVVRTNLPISQQISPQTNPQTKLLTAITKSSSTENKSLHNM